MQASVLKHEKRYKSSNNRNLNIQTYGEENDYPQQVIEVVDASGTAKSCLGIYTKFLSGRGFIDELIYNKVVNRKGQTLDYILRQAAADYARFGGFSLHVNYNANYLISEIQHIPFENVRFDKLDENGNFNRVAVYRDWGNRYSSLFKFNKDDIEFFDLYNPRKEEIKKQLTEKEFSYSKEEEEITYTDYDWEGYKGQVLYYSNQGEKTYPIPIFDSVITDISTEEAISDVSYRNASNNFFISGIIVEYMSREQSDSQESKLKESILEFQGATKACKMMHVSVERPEDKPEFISLDNENFDKYFDSTRKAIKESIGAAFMQPPILRAEDVGANFGADLMKNAYNFYNSVIENDRIELERIFTELFKHWHELIEGDFTINALSYDTEDTLIEKLGTEGFNQVMTILDKTDLNIQQKRIMIKGLFSLDDEELNTLVPL